MVKKYWFWKIFNRYFVFNFTGLHLSRLVVDLLHKAHIAN